MAKKDNLLDVRISKATHVEWEGKAKSVSSKNADGPFDILPMHANFISLINGEPIHVVKEDGSEENYASSKSVVFVTNNQVKIYSDIE